MEVDFVVGARYRFYLTNGNPSSSVYFCRGVRGKSEVTFSLTMTRIIITYKYREACRFWKPEIPKKIRRINGWK